MHERAAAESLRVYHLLLCKSSREMPDTGGRANACYSLIPGFISVFFITIYPHSFRLFFSWSLFAKPEGGWSFYWHGQLLGQDKKWPEIKSSWKRKKNLIYTIYFNDSLALLLKWKTQIEQMTSCTRANVKTTRSSWKIAENMQTPHAYSNYRTRLNSTAFEFASQRNFLTSICGCMPNMVVKILD